MRSWMAVGCALSFAVIVCGCQEGAPKMTTRVDVSGTVFLDGKLMNAPDAEISFSLPGEAPALMPIENGMFAGKAPVGDVRVEIRAMKQGEPVVMDGKPVEGSGKYNFIAEQYNDKSTLKATISKDGEDDLKFNVESKK